MGVATIAAATVIATNKPQFTELVVLLAAYAVILTIDAAYEELVESPRLDPKTQVDQGFDHPDTAI